ncbi:MAG: MFS transporter [Opitutaceae bacterium]|nr:MFS transporter [Opitutaceae bacterium]
MDSPTVSTPAPKVYQVGTLSYTRGALLQVMFWMLWGDFCFQLLESLPAAVIPLQLRWEGASDTLIGLKGSVSSLIAFLWYPVVGSQSDRHRGRLGRRRPFLLWCMPPVILSLLLLGLAKPAGSMVHELLVDAGLGAYVTVPGCTLVWIACAFIIFLIFNAYVVQVYACLVADVIPPEVIGKFTGIYRAVGALGSLAFHRWGLGYVEGNTFAVYACTGLLYATAFGLLVWRVKEGEYPPPPPPAPGGRFGAVKGYLKESFTNRFYLKFFSVTFFHWGSLAPLGFIVFFATQAGKEGYAATLGLSLQEFGAIKGWTFLVQIPVFLVVGYFVDRFHPLRVAILGLLLTSITYFACYALVVDADSLLLWSCLNNAAIAVYLGAAMAMGPRLLPRERYGQFVSANLIFGITSLIVAPPAIGLLMEYIRDYRYSFLFSGLSNFCAFLACIALFLQWRQLGGDKGYQAPSVG